MGIDYNSILIFGVLKSEVFEEVETVQKITKYNEDSGEPYEKEIKITKYYLFGNEVEEYDEISDIFGDVGVEEVLQSGYRFNPEGMIGIIISDSDSWDGIEESSIEKAKEQFWNFANKHSKIDLNPKLYNVLHIW